MRLASDLGNVQQKMAQALQKMDQAQLRAQTHVLISLAGAVGAEHLQNLAQVLNSAAHKLDQDAISELSAKADRGISRLLQIIDQEQNARAEVTE